ncbi:MAG TPA: phage major capsid protein, partial [Hanamia sp.]|nr:phage major capsid protein [Hanamia sp.]
IRNATLKYWAGGNDNLSTDEKNILIEHSKSMNSFTGTDGGYAVMPELDRAIVQLVRETSPIRQYAEVMSIGTDRLVEPYEGDDFASGWVGELEDRTDTDNGKLKEIAWDIHEQYAMPQVSQKLLDDAYFDIENYVINKLAGKFARAENTAFVTGDGIKKPRGFLTYTDGTSGFEQIEQIPSGGASTVTANGLIDLVESMKAPFLSGAVFMLKRSTVKDIRKLIDGNGNYLWGMGLNGGTSPDLLGYPIVRADDMPAVQAGALAIVFANFREAYRIVDRFGTRLLRDPYTKKGFVKLYTTKRVGGGVRNFDAIKIQDIAAS